MKAYLIYNNQVFHIKRSPLKIGRSLDNDIVIREPTISRVHAQILSNEDEFILEDLSSTAGTFINGDRIKKSRLKSGDSIMISNIPLVFVYNAPQLGSRAKTPAAPREPFIPDNEPTVHEPSPNWRPEDGNSLK